MLRFAQIGKTLNDTSYLHPTPRMRNSQRGYTTLDIVRMVTDANLELNTIVPNMSDAGLARIIADMQPKAVTLKTAAKKNKKK